MAQSRSYSAIAEPRFGAAPSDGTAMSPLVGDGSPPASDLSLGASARLEEKLDLWEPCKKSKAHGATLGFVAQVGPHLEVRMCCN